MTFDSATPTSNKSRKSRHRHSQRHRFHNEGVEMFAIWSTFEIIFSHILRHMRRNSYFSASSHNDNAIGFNNRDFL